MHTEAFLYQVCRLHVTGLVVCIHSGVLPNNRPMRDGANKINSEALTRNLSLFFLSEVLNNLHVQGKTKVPQRTRRKRVVKHTGLPLRVLQAPASFL